MLENEMANKTQQHYFGIFVTISLVSFMDINTRIYIHANKVFNKEAQINNTQKNGAQLILISKISLQPAVIRFRVFHALLFLSFTPKYEGISVSTHKCVRRMFSSRCIGSHLSMYLLFCANGSNTLFTRNTAI